MRNDQKDDKNRIQDEGAEKQSLWAPLAKVVEVLSSPISMSIPMFIATFLVGTLALTAGLVYSVVVLTTEPEITATAPDARQTQQLSDAQKDTIIFNEILAGAPCVCP